jgi:hypothetical protein
VSSRPQPDLGPRYRAVRIVAVALLLAVGIYVVVIELLSRGIPMSYPLRGQIALGYFFLAVGVVAVVAAGVLRRVMLSRAGAGPGERIQGASIVSLALAETPAVFGLLVFVATGQKDAAYALIVLAVAALALYFPRWSQWEEWAREPRAASR